MHKYRVIQRTTLKHSRVLANSVTIDKDSNATFYDENDKPIAFIANVESIDVIPPTKEAR